MARVDRERILQETDLLAVIERELGPAVRRSGRWFFFRCPFHGEGKERTPSLGVTPDNGRYKCFSGACEARGNVLDWVIAREGLGPHDIRGAAEVLGKLPPEQLRARAPVRSEVVARLAPPGEVWQARVWSYLDYAKSQLWEDANRGALEYLLGRGLTEDTIREWELGFNPGDVYDEAGKWGIADAKKVYLSMGITLPCLIDGVCWYVQCRRPALAKDGGLDSFSGAYLDGALPGYLPERKYWAVRGGNLNALWGVDQVRGEGVLVLEEGEFNALVLWQEAGDMVDVVSSGSASLRPEALWPWRDVFLGAGSVLVRFDPDAAGKAGKIVEALGGRCRRVQVPEGSDTNEFLQRGGSVRDWLGFELARLGVGYGAE